MKRINKVRMVNAGIVSVFIWISLVGCATVDTQVATTEKTGISAVSDNSGITASVPAAIDDRKLSRKHWDERMQRWYKTDKASHERVYKNPKTGEWYIIDKATGKEIYI